MMRWPSHVAATRASLPLGRRLAGYALAAVLTPRLTLVLASLRGQLEPAIDALAQADRAAEAARPIAEANRMRTALLAAVSHDLRTPLAAAKAAVSCLRSGHIALTAEDRHELLATADESLNQLAHLIASLWT